MKFLFKFKLGSVNILLSISDLVQNVRKGYLWNYKSCNGEISPHCAYWGGLQLCHIHVSCLYVANVLKYFINL